ncbi:MAG: cyclic nucleotide-binding domain-containing protein [Cellvibrionaceae bacterium]|nr:cyclic nucleotide-binding domain-containing protein [Cellvibrionaceae bacterium]
MSESEVLSRFSPISALTGQFLSEVSKQARLVSVAKGTMLFKRGKILADHYYLLEGEVDLINNEFGVEKVKSGAERSWRPLNTHSPTVVSAVAKTHVRYFTLNIDWLARQISQANNPKPLVNETEGHMGADGVEAGIEVGELSDAKDWMACLLQSPVFSRIPWTQLQELFTRFETIEVPAGEKLIREGARGDYFYVLAAGSALVTNRSGSVDLELKEGSYFGEEALISDAPRNASIIMCTPGVVKRLSAEDFGDLVVRSVIQYVDQKSLDKQKKPVKILDVRLPLEFRAGHLAGSVNVPLSRLRESLEDLGQANLYAISDEAGPRADIAAYLLCQAGFEAVVLKNAGQQELLSEVS